MWDILVHTFERKRENFGWWFDYDYDDERAHNKFAIIIK